MHQNDDEKVFLFEHIDEAFYKEDDKTWFVKDVDVGNSFQKYQMQVLSDIQSKSLNLESNTHEILALSNILLLTNNQQSPTFKQFLTKDIIQSIEEEVVEKKFKIVKKRLSFKIKNRLADIIMDLCEKKLKTTTASKEMTKLLSDEECNAINLITGVRNLVESLPRSKFHSLLRKSNSCSSYVHCILNPLFTAPENNTHLVWLNLQTLKESEMRPDFIANILVDSTFQGPALIGEVKGEDKKNDPILCLLDLVRIGILSGQSINENGYDGVLGVHVVGVQMTFYIFWLMGPGVYVMLEITTITIPKDFTHIRSYIANMEDLFPVLNYYQLCTNLTKKELNMKNKRNMIDLSMVKVIIDQGKDNKGPCTIVLNH